MPLVVHKSFRQQYTVSHQSAPIPSKRACHTPLASSLDGHASLQRKHAGQLAIPLACRKHEAAHSLSSVKPAHQDVACVSEQACSQDSMQQLQDQAAHQLVLRTLQLLRCSSQDDVAVWWSNGCGEGALKGRTLQCIVLVLQVWAVSICGCARTACCCR